MKILHGEFVLVCFFYDTKQVSHTLGSVCPNISSTNPVLNKMKVTKFIFILLRLSKLFIDMYFDSNSFPDSYKLQMDLERKKREQLEIEILNLQGKKNCKQNSQ